MNNVYYIYLHVSKRLHTFWIETWSSKQKKSSLSAFMMCEERNCGNIMQAKLNNIKLFWKVKNARRVTKFMWPLKLVPAKVRGQLILNSDPEYLPFYMLERSIRRYLMAWSACPGTNIVVCSASKPSMHRAFEQKLSYFTFIHNYNWNKTFPPLPLIIII